MSQRPLISIVMITYNHERFVAQAIQSVLMQKVDFDYEFIIADDLSTDRTCQIIQQVLDQHEVTTPVRFTRHTVNKGIASNFAWALKQATGKYIAICEGDDYWTDALKLKKQVNFLEKNEDYAMACNASSEVNTNGHEIKVATREETVINLAMLLREGWFIRTASMVFRTDILRKGFPDFYYEAYSTDYILQVMILKTGLCKYFPDIMSAYRRHEGGITQASYKLQLNRWITKIKLLDTLNSFTNKKYDYEISLQQKHIKQQISFYLYRYPKLLNEMGFKFYLNHGSLFLFFNECGQRLSKKVIIN